MELDKMKKQVKLLTVIWAVFYILACGVGFSWMMPRIIHSGFFDFSQSPDISIVMDIIFDYIIACVVALVVFFIPMGVTIIHKSKKAEMKKLRIVAIAVVVIFCLWALAAASMGIALHFHLAK